MKAAIFQGKGKVEVGELPDPTMKEPTDAIVRIVLSCVCGSDLWFYRGESPHPDKSIGHEFMGVVEEVGPEVHTIKKGDFVISPFKYSDGTCAHCRADYPSSCIRGGFFTDETGGGQGEVIRVPLADGTLVKVPGSDYSNEVMKSLLTLSDVMCTGHHAAVSAEVQKGDIIAVVGDGAVGLCAIIAAKRLGAQRILALSRNPARQQLAREFGATDIVEQRGEEAVEVVMRLTDGVGVDAALECVGTGQATETAFAIARPGSIVGYVGVPHGAELTLPRMFGRNIGVHGGGAPVRAYLPELLEDVLAGRINPGRVFDFTTNLDGVADAYAAMDERRAIKSLLRVSHV